MYYMNGLINVTTNNNNSTNDSDVIRQALLDSGVIPGSDMTVEAALMKLGYILSKNEWPLEKKRKV